MDTRTCSKCGQILPVTEYYKTRRKSDGKWWYYGHCKKCHKELSNKWIFGNAEQYRKYRNEWAAKRRQDFPEKFVEIDLKRRTKVLGTSPEWYKEQLVKQGGVCAICRREEVNRSGQRNNRVRSLAIDHCHTTGKHRGLLCSACNQAVGMIDKYPGWLEAATNYVAS